MMKRFFIAALALIATLPAAINVQAQDDDIYFSKKASKKAAKEAIYSATKADEWQTEANNDWNLDEYNRRGKNTESTDTPYVGTVTQEGEEPAFYYEIPDGNGGTTKVNGNKKILKGSDADKYKIINDTVVLVEQYYYSDLIRRFHNPFFNYFRYSPWYDVAYYDPFYWDYCFYDPWWYVTPSFGFHWGNWYGGWNYGYYSGWYGGWYSPFYSPMPHWHYGYYAYGVPTYSHHEGSNAAHRGSSRNSFGGHFAHRGGWRGDGGANRMSSAGTNRSYRAANGAHVNRSNNGTYAAGPSLRGRNTVNGRLSHSNMQSTNHKRTESALNELGSRANGNNSGASRPTHSANRSLNNSEGRRYSAGMHQRSDGSTRRAASSNASSSTYNNPYRYERSSSRQSSQSSSYEHNSYHSSSAATRNSGSYSSGSSGYSGGGGGGGSHSHGGSRAGRR